MNGLSPGLRRFPLFESRFDGEKIFVFAVLRMSLDYRPSPGETATPCRADYIFGEYLGQCIGEFSVEYGNLSEAAHSPNSQGRKFCSSPCINFKSSMALAKTPQISTVWEPGAAPVAPPAISANFSLRQRIVARAAKGETPYSIAKSLGINRHTAAKYVG
jgi:hypothetical protein